MKNLTRTKQVITGISFIAFPLLFIIGNAIHANIFSFSLPQDTLEWMQIIRGNKLQQIGNLLEYFSAPFLMVMAFSLINTIREKAWLWGLTGGLMAILGCVSMIGSKGSFCLSTAAFDTLPDAQFHQIYPAFETLFTKAGLLKVTLALPLLPLGFFVQGIGLLKGKYIPKWQAVLILTGSLLLVNPGFEAINLLASILLLIGFNPSSLQLITGNIKSGIRSF